jgi:A/G-specific adenine glycosylase
VLQWYAARARALPWREDDRTAWGVLVSEVMLQQTQVARVEPIWRDWLQRWPTPTRMADGPVGDVLRAWGGLGYPRRALRLHAAAVVIRDEHGGEVPDDVAALRALPGVGEYTASAVAAFAHGARVPVLDTNVRRVLSRWGLGLPLAGGGTITRQERALAQQLLPEAALAPTWSVAVMELGALVCRARHPSCPDCPIRTSCAWHAAGRPAPGLEPRRQAQYQGSDRQARGMVLRLLRDGPTSTGRVESAWVQARGGDPEAQLQARRAVASLRDDGLVVAEGLLLRLPD